MAKEKAEIGRILGKLRVDYSETQAKQAVRLGIDIANLNRISTGNRALPYEVYKKILECYDTSAYGNDIDLILIKRDVWERFKAKDPAITTKEIIYLLYGEHLE